MKVLRHPATLLLLFFIAFASCVVVTTWQLPPLVATHFNIKGHADGWMSRTSILKFTLGFGFGLLHYFPDSLINIPDRDYWLVPERRDTTFLMVWRHAFWLACLTVALMAGLHALILRANAVSPPGVSPKQIAVLSGGFLLGTLLWSLTLVRKFRR